MLLLLGGAGVCGVAYLLGRARLRSPLLASLPCLAFALPCCLQPATCDLQPATERWSLPSFVCVRTNSTTKTNRLGWGKKEDRTEAFKQQKSKTHTVDWLAWQGPALAKRRDTAGIYSRDNGRGKSALGTVWRCPNAARRWKRRAARGEIQTNAMMEWKPQAYLDLPS
jgi:hypothetical protein